MSTHLSILGISILGMTRNVNHDTVSSRNYNLSGSHNAVTQETVHGNAGHYIHRPKVIGIGSKHTDARAEAQNEEGGL